MSKVAESPMRSESEPIDRNGGEGSAASILEGMHKRSQADGLTPTSAGQEIRRVFGSLFEAAWNDFRTQVSRKPEEIAPRTPESPTKKPVSVQTDVVYRTEEELVDDNRKLPRGPILLTAKPPVRYSDHSAEQRVRKLPYDHDFDRQAKRNVRAEMINYTRATIDDDLQEYSNRYQEAFTRAHEILTAMKARDASGNLLTAWQQAVAQMRAMALSCTYLSGGLVKGEGNHYEPFIDKGIASEYAEAHKHFEQLQQQVTEIEEATREAIEAFAKKHPIKNAEDAESPAAPHPQQETIPPVSTQDSQQTLSRRPWITPEMVQRAQDTAASFSLPPLNVPQESRPSPEWLRNHSPKDTKPLNDPPKETQSKTTVGGYEVLLPSPLTEREAWEEQLRMLALMKDTSDSVHSAQHLSEKDRILAQRLARSKDPAWLHVFGRR